MPVTADRAALPAVMSVFVPLLLMMAALALRVTVAAPPVAIDPPVPKVMFCPAVAAILPEVLLTAALSKMSLVPVAVRPTVPAPPAVTAAPRVSVPPVACKVMLPADPVVMGAVLVVRLPLLVTLTLAPGVSVMPVTVSVPLVFIRLIALLALLVAVKLLTVLAPLSVVPVAELVDSRPVVLKDPVSVMLPGRRHRDAARAGRDRGVHGDVARRHRVPG